MKRRSNEISHSRKEIKGIKVKMRNPKSSI